MDDLKELWKAEHDQFPSAKRPLNLARRSNSLLESMKRNLMLENRFNVIVGGLSVVYLYASSQPMIAALLLMVLILMGLYYRFLISNFETKAYQIDVHNYMHQAYKMLSTFVIRYRTLGIILIPISYILGLIEAGDQVDISELVEIEKMIIMLTVGVAVYGFVELYIYLVYGKKLKELKELIESMDLEERSDDTL